MGSRSHPPPRRRHSANPPMGQTAPGETMPERGSAGTGGRVLRNRRRVACHDLAGNIPAAAGACPPSDESSHSVHADCGPHPHPPPEGGRSAGNPDRLSPRRGSQHGNQTLARAAAGPALSELLRNHPATPQRLPPGKPRLTPRPDGRHGKLRHSPALDRAPARHRPGRRFPSPSRMPSRRRGSRHGERVHGASTSGPLRGKGTFENSRTRAVVTHDSEKSKAPHDKKSPDKSACGHLLRRAAANPLEHGFLHARGNRWQRIWRHAAGLHHAE